MSAIRWDTGNPNRSADQWRNDSKVGLNFTSCSLDWRLSHTLVATCYKYLIKRAGSYLESDQISRITYDEIIVLKKEEIQFITFITNLWNVGEKSPNTPHNRTTIHRQERIFCLFPLECHNYVENIPTRLDKYAVDQKFQCFSI